MALSSILSLSKLFCTLILKLFLCFLYLGAIVRLSPFKYIYVYIWFIYFIFFIRVFCFYVYKWIAHVHCACEGQKRARSPEDGVMGDCERPCGCWDLNPGPLKEKNKCSYSLIQSILSFILQILSLHCILWCCVKFEIFTLLKIADIVVVLLYENPWKWYGIWFICFLLC